MPKRGILADDDGPLTIPDMAMKTGFPEEIFKIALSFLCKSDIEWITKTEADSVCITAMSDQSAMSDMRDTLGTEQNRTEGNRTEIPADSKPDGFSEFWLEYPQRKRKSKGDAEKAWKVLKPAGELKDKIMAQLAIVKESRDWQKQGGEFIPYPATWLRNKGWEDETEESNDNLTEE